MAEPGVLESAPQFRLAVARLPKGSEQHTQDLLAARYPNVTLLRTREILDKILAVLHRIAQGIRFLGGFTVLAGVAILAGSVSAGSLRRGREAALLKTLGVTRRGSSPIFAVEHALTGPVTGYRQAEASSSPDSSPEGLRADPQFDPSEGGTRSQCLPSDGRGTRGQLAGATTPADRGAAVGR